MPPAATTSDQALSNYNNFTSGMQNPDQILQGQEQSLGVPQEQQQVSGLRQAITNTTNLLNNVAPSVYGRTQNSLVTTAQAGRQIQNEQAPLQTDLSKSNTDLTNTNSDLQTNLTRAQQLADAKVTGQTTQQAQLMDLYKTLLGKEQTDRQFAADQAAATAKASSGSGGGGGGGGAKALSTSDLAASVRQGLVGVQGGDGHVSPKSLAHAYNVWVGQGQSPKSFWTYFQGFWSPTFGKVTQNGFTGDYGAWFNKWVNAGA